MSPVPRFPHPNTPINSNERRTRMYQTGFAAIDGLATADPTHDLEKSAERLLTVAAVRQCDYRGMNLVIDEPFRDVTWWVEGFRWHLEGTFHASPKGEDGPCR